MHHLPPDSATRRIEAKAPEGWDIHAYLLADLFAAFAGEQHPARPDPAAAEKAERYSAARKALEAQRARRAAAASADPV